MSYDISKYKIDKLGPNASILPGFAFKSERFTDNEKDIPLIKGENVHQGYIDWQGAKRWPVDEYDLLKKYQLSTGDIVLAMDRPWVTAGLKWSYIKSHDPKSLLVQRVARIRAKNKLDQGFLRQVISSKYFADYLQPIVTGVNVPHISAKQIGDFRFPIPEIGIQRKIAAILTAYDDLIETNKRRIALLEQMAEELYREWFVRMRFPGYQNTKFVKGVPEGWKQVASSDVFDVQSGGTPKTDTPAFWDGPIPFFTPKDAPDHIYVSNTEKWITIKGLNSCNSPLYPKHTIFLTARGTVGKVALTQCNMAMNQSCYALIPKIEEKVYFFYLAMLNAVEIIKGVSKSGVFDNIIVDTFRIVPINLPNKNRLIRDFNNMVGPMFSQVEALLLANVNLTQTRDLLLPRLISGKLSVEDLDIQLPPSMREEAD